MRSSPLGEDANNAVHPAEPTKNNDHLFRISLFFITKSRYV